VGEGEEGPLLVGERREEEGRLQRGEELEKGLSAHNSHSLMGGERGGERRLGSLPSLASHPTGEEAEKVTERQERKM